MMRKSFRFAHNHLEIFPSELDGRLAYARGPGVDKDGLAWLEGADEIDGLCGSEEGLGVRFGRGYAPGYG